MKLGEPGNVVIICLLNYYFYFIKQDNLKVTHDFNIDHLKI